MQLNLNLVIITKPMHSGYENFTSLQSYLISFKTFQEMDCRSKAVIPLLVGFPTVLLVPRSWCYCKVYWQKGDYALSQLDQELLNLREKLK